MSEITSKELSACESGLILVGVKTDNPGLQRESDANGDITASAVSSSSPPCIKREESTMTVGRNNSSKTLLGGGQTQQQLQESGRNGLPGEDLERRYKLCLRMEIVGLSILIVIVWGLLTLPIVFYYFPAAVS